MIARGIEGGHKETSYIKKVSSISDNDDASGSLASVVFRRVISLVGG